MSAFVKFTVYRLGLLVIPLLVLLWLGVPPLWALLFAAVFSALTSLFLLRAPREELSRELEATITRRRADRAARLAGERTDEDDEDAEAARPRHQGPEHPS